MSAFSPLSGGDFSVPSSFCIPLYSFVAQSLLISLSDGFELCVFLALVIIVAASLGHTSCAILPETGIVSAVELTRGAASASSILGSSPLFPTPPCAC